MTGMGPNKLSLTAILLSAALTSCMPKQRVMIQTPLTHLESELLREYDSHDYGFPAFDQNFHLLGRNLARLELYRDIDRDGNFYSMKAESNVGTSTIVSYAEDILNDIVDDYDVDGREVDDVVNYIYFFTEDVGKIRIDVRYKVDEGKGALVLYENRTPEQEKKGIKDRFLTSRLISSDLALSTMHYCSMKFMNQEMNSTFLKDDYLIVHDDDRIKIVKRKL